MQLTEMAKDLTKTVILAHGLSPDEARAMLYQTFDTLQVLQAQEPPAAISGVPPAPAASAEVPPAPPAPAEPWQKSITKHTVKCLECGRSFKQLSLRHLRIHGLDPKTYRRKYGIPVTQALSGKDVTRRRRELAQQIRPWEQAHQGRGKAASKRQRGSRP